MSSKKQLIGHINRLKKQLTGWKTDYEKLLIVNSNLEKRYNKLVLLNDKKSTGPVWNKRVILIALITGIAGLILLVFYFLIK